ncbi:MAG TPA: IS1595 family transposase [Acidimicrobiia bacterium]|jgi:transposase-like protein|nr:IS1595 family transposase [Acidimicrobiia bacterium]
MAQRTSIPALQKRLTSEAAAYEYMEELRWPKGPVCPHCQSTAKHYFLTPKAEAGRTTRRGKVSERRVWKCKACRRQFTVTVGTIFHGSKIPLTTWLFVVFEIVSSKNGVAAREIQRKYDLMPKTAWFMMHRIREAMKRDPKGVAMMVGTIEADEAYIGGKSRAIRGTLSPDAKPSKRIIPEKTPVLTLVNRETGEARSKVMAKITSENLYNAIARQVDVRDSRLMTDESNRYNFIGNQFGGGHDAVYHAGGEYVRGDITSNRAENYFSQLKRSLDGTHHRISAEHLDRYLAEFDFRFSTRKLSDTQRMARLMGQTGRRLSYRPLINGR